MQQGNVGTPRASEVEALVSAIAGTVVEAVKADLEAVAKSNPVLARSALAASALALAREMDATNSATSKSMCARALLETMDRIRELAPAAAAGDAVDEIAARRSRRIGRSA